MAASHRVRPRRTVRPFGMRVTGTAGALAAVSVALLTAPPAGAVGGDGLDGRTPGAFSGWDHQRLAPGADLYSTLLEEGGTARWTTTVSVDGAQLLSRSEAQATAGELRAAGFTPRTERVEWPRGSADRHGTLGVRIRVGSYASQEEADARRADLDEAGFDAATDWTGGDGAGRGGMTRVKAAVIDPRRFGGSLGSDTGAAVSGRETLTSLSSRAGALLGVNAGFFVMEEEDGVPGAAAGVAAHDGRLQSAATNGRVAAVLRGDGLRPELRHLRTELRVRAEGGGADGPARTVDGVNRRPGLIRNCGGVGGDRPTELPRHDITCTDEHELVLFTGELGASTPSGEGVEAVLDRTGRVLELRSRGGKVPAGGNVLAGTGEGAGWLRAHAVPGSDLKLKKRVLDEDGRTVRLGPGDDIVNGGPRLVRDGKVAVDFGADGIDRPGDPTAPYAWGLKRNPRTALGVDGRGRVVLVTAEGRQPGYSDGLSVTETARLMASLGAVQAMNLDGGGSTGMTVGGALITRPSDPAGERAIGDALLLRR
ncbi:phosphodiester glycosidase family protein [Streptomyces ovatisporus]|uniref:Phosphodiester glycosidase family protein n=1 Tax=Streptomyces ovatisporus TaxID=1128682 RepID=A0ABV9A4V8_9ACTN